MAITSAVCNTFKAELMKGGHNFNTSGQTPAGNAFKLSLYSSASANLDGTTSQYTAPTDGTADPTNTYEVTSTSSGYTTGGKALTNQGVTGTSSTTNEDTESSRDSNLRAVILVSVFISLLLIVKLTNPKNDD